MSQFHADQPEAPRLPDQPIPRRPTPMQSRRQLPRWKLVLLADGKNDLMYVVRSVMELTRFPRAEATHKMWEAHHRGQSILLITYLERGELYVEQFVSRGLDVKIEPAWN